MLLLLFESPFPNDFSLEKYLEGEDASLCGFLFLDCCVGENFDYSKFAEAPSHYSGLVLYV